MPFTTRHLSAPHAATLAWVVTLTAPAAVAGEDLYGALDHIDTDAAFEAEIPAHLEDVLDRAGLEVGAQTRRMDGDVVVLENVAVVDPIDPDDKLMIDEIGVVSHEKGVHSRLVATRPDGEVRGKFVNIASDERDYFSINTHGADLNFLTEHDDHFETFLAAETVRFSTGGYDGAFHGAKEAPTYGALFNDFSFEFETAPRSLGLSISAGDTRIDANPASEDTGSGHSAGPNVTMNIGEFGISMRNDGLDHQDTDMLFDLEALEGGAKIDVSGHAREIATEERRGDAVARSSVASIAAEAFYGKEELSLDLDTRGLNADGSLALGFLREMTGAEDDTTPDLSLSAERKHLALRLPVFPSDEAQHLGVDLLFAQVSPSGDFWSMVDPGDDLIHEPLDVAMALDGKAVAAQHIVSAAAGAVAAGFMGGHPEEQLLNALESLDVAIEGHLQAIGARAVLDASMNLEADDQLPHLISKVTMSGVEDALANLAATPLVEEGDVMGAAMALEMFTTPADNGSRIMEFEGKSDGSALLNGNPM